MPSAACGMGEARLGPPTAAELAMVAGQLKAAAYVPFGTNQGNNFAYGNTEKQMAQLRSMYALNHDLWFLDQSIVFADFMLATRNDPMTGRVIWTGKREPCWPNNDDTAPDAAVCGVESGLVASQLLYAARTIFQDRSLWPRTVGVPDPHGYGATYLARARTYLTESERTMDYLVAHYVDPTQSNRVYTPKDAAFAALGPNYTKAAGRAVPWNQQNMITEPLSLIGDILLDLGEDQARVMAGDLVTRAALDWFRSELDANKYQLNGVTVYKWGYNPGDLFHVEDLAHASGDVNMLASAYQRGRFGVDRALMLPMANTFFELVAKPDGTYADHVDGKGSRATVSAGWNNFDEFRPGIVARLNPKLTIDATTPLADAIAILGLRKRFCP